MKIIGTGGGGTWEAIVGQNAWQNMSYDEWVDSIPSGGIYIELLMTKHHVMENFQ